MKVIAPGRLYGRILKAYNSTFKTQRLGQYFLSEYADESPHTLLYYEKNYGYAAQRIYEILQYAHVNDVEIITAVKRCRFTPH